MRQLLQPRADGDDQRAQVEVADIAAIGEDILREGFGEIGLALASTVCASRASGDGAPAATR